MGLWADRQTIYMSSLYQLWRFENAIEPGQAHDDYDAVYVPQVGYTTGDLDVHDVAVGKDGEVMFVNTLFSCLATTSETHSFHADLATAVHQQARGGGPVLSQWPGNLGWRAALYDGGGQD